MSYPRHVWVPGGPPLQIYDNGRIMQAGRELAVAKLEKVAGITNDDAETEYISRAEFEAAMQQVQRVVARIDNEFGAVRKLLAD